MGTHLFGNKRDYYYRRERLPEDEYDLKKFKGIDGKIQNGIKLDEYESDFYKKYCQKNGKTNLLELENRNVNVDTKK